MAVARKLHWWHWLPRKTWRVVVIVDEADDVPLRLPHKTAAVVGPQEAPKWVAFDCPCRGGHRVMLNLDRRRRPSWSLAAGRRLTLSPSIDDFAIKRCHFFIRQGKVEWAFSGIEVDR